MELAQTLFGYLLNGLLMAAILIASLSLFGCVMCAWHEEGPVWARVIGGITMVIPVLILFGWLVSQ